MKKLLLFAFYVQILSTVNAQIPNADFESWTDNEPEGWFTNNSGTAILDAVSPVIPGRASQTGAKLETKEYVGQPFIARMNSKFPETSKPDALHGWYKLSSAGGQAPQLDVTAFYGKPSIGGAGFAFKNSTNVFEEFVATMFYSGSATDTFTIQFSTYGSAVGTTLIIDDLSWDGLLSVNELSGNEPVLEGTFPRAGVTDIIYSLPVASDVTLSVFDLNGKALKVLVNEKQNPGRFKAQIDAGELSAGLYLCQLKAAGTIRTTKIFIAN